MEFKALNPQEKMFAKDFCKLREERTAYPEVSTFFILLLDGCNKGTKKSIENKIMSKDISPRCLNIEDFII